MNSNKLFFTFFLVVLIFRFAVGQSLTLFNNDGAIPNGSTITIWSDTSNITLKSHVFVTNNSATSKAVKVKKIEVSLVSGTANFFCWDLCFDPTTYISPNSINIAAGDTNFNDFEGEYQHNGNISTSTITYIFFDSKNPNDSVSVIINYKVTYLGLNDICYYADFSNPYPNPANSYTTFNYKLSDNVVGAVLVVSNLLGMVVKEEHITNQQGKLIIPINDLKSGLYFYSLLVNNRVVFTKKLVVKD